MKTQFHSAFTAGAFALSLFGAANATTYRYVDAEAASSVDGDTWALTSRNVTYSAVRKGITDIPWISPSQHFDGKHSVGFRIRPTDGSQGSTDKITYPLVLGNAAFAMPADGGSGYTGYAIKFPSAQDFQSPNGKVLCAQWWQGAPYGPPLRMAITGSNGSHVSYRFWVLNNDTLGNPSAVPIDIGGGTVGYGNWNKFVVYTHWDYNGGGHVSVWQNHNLVLSWYGKLGYDPNTIPYKNPPANAAHPNRKMQIEFGLYREAQSAKHMVFFDEVAFGDSYNDANP
jgi:Polysaccharide lyase